MTWDQVLLLLLLNELSNKKYCLLCYFENFPQFFSIYYQVPGAIPNWKGAPSHRLLEPTKKVFPAPLCTNAKAKRKRKYRNTCRCASGEDAVEVAPDGKIRGNCTG